MKLFHQIFLLTALVFISILFSSCSSVDSYGDEALSIHTKNSTVILTNNSKQIIHYILVESETAARIDISPNHFDWPSIEAGAELSIQYEQIMGYKDSSTEAWITWRTAKGKSGNSQTIKL